MPSFRVAPRTEPRRDAPVKYAQILPATAPATPLARGQRHRIAVGLVSEELPESTPEEDRAALRATLHSVRATTVPLAWDGEDPPTPTQQYREPPSLPAQSPSTVPIRWENDDER